MVWLGRRGDQAVSRRDGRKGLERACTHSTARRDTSHSMVLARGHCRNKDRGPIHLKHTHSMAQRPSRPLPHEYGHMPSINLSKPSHCVFPVDRRYRMCCCGGGGGLSVRMPCERRGGALVVWAVMRERGWQTRSWTWRCLSISCLAKSLVSSRFLWSLILRVPRNTVR